MRRKTYKPLDGIDKEILRQLMNHRRLLSGRQIAHKVGRTAPAIRPRLNNLQGMGVIKPHPLGVRKIVRKVNNKSQKFNAPRSILWGLDIKPEKKKR